MLLEGEERIEAPKEMVWAALNSPDILKKCIPGCETLENVEHDIMTATVLMKIGPIKERFEGEVRLMNINAPESYTISGEGTGGIAGFAKGRANVVLSAENHDVTILTYTAEADVGGKIAQLGSRLVQATAKRLAEQFFLDFNRHVSVSNVTE